VDPPTPTCKKIDAEPRFFLASGVRLVLGQSRMNYTLMSCARYVLADMKKSRFYGEILSADDSLKRHPDVSE
jgi:hypothetical protein